MSKYSDFKNRVASIEEIREIISAMKNISILEINRVSRYLSNQKSVLETIESSAKDFFSFYSYQTSFDELRKGANNGQQEVYIAIGSERGFCGGFNETVASHLLELDTPVPVIAIGKKLHMALEKYKGEKEFLDGAQSIEEIESILGRVIHSLGSYPGGRLAITYNEESDNHIVHRIVRPYDLLAEVGHVEFPGPPLINGDAEHLLIQLLDQYVFALLYFAFFTSYMAENRQRLNHMDRAESRIARKLEQYHLKLNNLRQEEITEEIEVILLNLEGPGPG